MKELSLMFQQPKSKHISIHDEDAVLPHVAAFNHQSLKKYGNLNLSYNLISYLSYETFGFGLGFGNVCESRGMIGCNGQRREGGHRKHSAV
ncbi:hypothetical protein R6Q59_008008 [Mikania micrantha]